MCPPISGPMAIRYSHDIWIGDGDLMVVLAGSDGECVMARIGWWAKLACWQLVWVVGGYGLLMALRSAELKALDLLDGPPLRDGTWADKLSFALFLTILVSVVVSALASVREGVLAVLLRRRRHAGSSGHFRSWNIWLLRSARLATHLALIGLGYMEYRSGAVYPWQWMVKSTSGRAMVCACCFTAILVLDSFVHVPFCRREQSE